METSQAEVIKKCRKDLQRERIIKSVLCGMAVGFGVMFLVAFITWIFEFKGLWLTLGLGVAAWAGAALVFYFVVFTFTDMQVMQRLDRAGLDERMITMYQLRGDNSYMAQRQRDDANAVFAKAVKASGGKLIKAKIATAIICATSIVAPFGAGMTVVTGLSDYDVIPTLYELLSDGGLGGGSTTPTYTITYKVEVNADDEDAVGGFVSIGGLSLDMTAIASSSEDGVDRVEKGGATSAQAVIANGFYIEKWVDDKGVEYYPNLNGGYQPVFFSQDNVQKNMTVTVVFAKLGDGDDLGFNYYYDPNNKGDSDGGGGDSDGDDNGDSDGGDHGDGDETPPPDLGDNEPPPPPGNGPGGGNPAEEGNYIVDGETNYGENYDYYYKLAMEMLANGTDGYPPELVAALEAYFGILK